MSDFSVTRWELIPYDVSELLHNDIDMSVEDIKEKFTKVLLMHRISEKLFCKAVLNTTSKVIKRLFTIKSNYGAMKAKDKIIILKIYLWINDSEGVRKLRDWTNQIKSISGEFLFCFCYINFSFVFLASEFFNDQLSQPIESESEDVITINYDVCTLVLPGLLVNFKNKKKLYFFLC
jgi:hypothetical protein